MSCRTSEIRYEYRCELMRFRTPKAQGVWRKAKRTKLPIMVTLQVYETYSTKKTRNISYLSITNRYL